MAYNILNLEDCSSTQRTPELESEAVTNSYLTSPRTPSTENRFPSSSICQQMALNTSPVTFPTDILSPSFQPQGMIK